MKVFEVGALIFTAIVVVSILAIGQWAYGNVTGPLFNLSKKPKFEFMSPPQAYNDGGNTYLVLNLSDINGPDAYPASVTQIVISNGSYKLVLNSQQISESVVNVTKAPYDLKKAVGYNSYSGIYECLGTDATFTLKLPVLLSPGNYQVSLFTPALPPKSNTTGTFTVS